MSPGLGRDDIRALLDDLSAELAARGARAELFLVGGAALAVAYDATRSTRDLDAVFIPSDIVRQAASAVAAREGLAEDWLNDAVKGFLPGPDPDAQKCGSSSPRSWTRCRTDRGPAKLVVEQRARAVLAISDHTYVLAGGEVRMSGSPAELAESPAFVESFLGGTVARLPNTSTRRPWSR
jgi:hypothetical protein